VLYNPAMARQGAENPRYIRRGITVLGGAALVASAIWMDWAGFTNQFHDIKMDAFAIAEGTLLNGGSGLGFIYAGLKNQKMPLM
jgi:hypothetical protein